MLSKPHLVLSPQEESDLSSVRGSLYSRETFGTVDGPGIRYIFFLQGCLYRCLYCHNPDSVACRGGELWTAGQVLEETLRYKNYIRSGGVTFSGGEPLMQAEFVEACTRLLHSRGIHVAVDTAGVPLTDAAASAVNNADILLLDIKAIDDEMCRRLTGQTNRYSLEMLDYCEKIGKPVWLRQVLLRGYTLDDAQLNLLAQHLSKYSCIDRVELLPFHKLGEPKWEGLDRSYTLADVEATTREEADAARELLRSYGLKVQ